MDKHARASDRSGSDWAKTHSRSTRNPPRNLAASHGGGAERRGARGGPCSCPLCWCNQVTSSTPPPLQLLYDTSSENFLPIILRDRGRCPPAARDLRDRSPHSSTSPESMAGWVQAQLRLAAEIVLGAERDRSWNRPRSGCGWTREGAEWKTGDPKSRRRADLAVLLQLYDRIMTHLRPTYDLALLRWRCTCTCKPHYLMNTYV